MIHIVTSTIIGGHQLVVEVGAIGVAMWPVVVVVVGGGIGVITIKLVVVVRGALGSLPLRWCWRGHWGRCHQAGGGGEGGIGVVAVKRWWWGPLLSPCSQW